MSDFNSALNYVVENEGRGYETWPETDQPTNTGIIAADIAEYRMVPVGQIGATDVKNLSFQEITDIYKKLYWQKMRMDEVTNPGIATCIFDTGVVRGVSVAGAYTQRVLNLLNSGPLVVDGVIGFHTLAALNAMRSPKDFIIAFEHFEASGYLAIVARYPSDAKYLKGWMARTKRLLTLIT